VASALAGVRVGAGGEGVVLASGTALVALDDFDDTAAPAPSPTLVTGMVRDLAEISGDIEAESVELVLDDELLDALLA
jgi:hypothetical protein